MLQGAYKVKKWGSCLILTIIGYDNGGFLTAEDWIKVIILYHFEKITEDSFMIIREIHLQKWSKLSFACIHKMS